MKNWIAPLFVAAALYDGLLGLIGVAVPVWVYAQFNMPLPEHLGYVQLPALLMIVLAFAFIAIARDPRGNKNLIWYGVMVKVAFCLVAFGHFFFGTIPAMLLPFAIVDLIFIGLFIGAERAV
ncbi:MAG: hypothetical protein WCW67_01730 [Candidatus Margulisiibacteriota bacterium]|jgi:hypothetical protein